MPDTLAHYRILERIAARAMGEIFRARDTRLGRTVALHVIAPAISGDPTRRARFLRDAETRAALSHPNIAALFEIGEEAAQLFLAFEFVVGERLDAAIAGRPMNPRRAIDIAVQIADALAEAHACGIVHRDLTAAAIVVTPKGNAKLLDIGLSAWTANLEGDASGDDTGVSDQRVDTYALGAILFEMLTGRPPFDQGREVAARPSSVVSAVPRELDGIVGKALAASPDDRYDSAALMAARLRAVGEILEARRAADERAR
jgi:serine/threonine protein kinase